jgi:hypothetical protein
MRWAGQEHRALGALLPTHSLPSLRCRVKGERGAWEDRGVYAYGMYAVNAATQLIICVYRIEH